MRVLLKESIEFQPVQVELDGAVFTDFELCIVPDGTRPEGWQAPLILEGQPGLMIQDLDIGPHRVYVRVTSIPEIPVIEAGLVVIK